MMKTKSVVVCALVAAVTMAYLPVSADTPKTENGVTTIHMDEHLGYIAAQETLSALKPGKYKFVVSNKTPKMVGFQVQDLKSHKTLDAIPLAVGETKEMLITVGDNGIRYRCPINPTPWYDVEVSK